MKENKINKLVYYDKGQKYEIPIHIQKIVLIADFQDPLEIKIRSVCHSRKEHALWKNLVDFLIPYRKDEEDK